LLLDLVLLVHTSFAVFTVVGSFVALRWRRLYWLHLPCLLRGCIVELAGLTCPLTPLENRLRAASGLPTYRGDFLAHYLGAVLYPTGLTRVTQIGLGVLLIIVNVVGYTLLYRQRAQ
jgi:hypothetical protein